MGVGVGLRVRVRSGGFRVPVDPQDLDRKSEVARERGEVAGRRVVPEDRRVPLNGRTQGNGFLKRVDFFLGHYSQAPTRLVCINVTMASTPLFYAIGLPYLPYPLHRLPSL